MPIHKTTPEGHINQAAHAHNSTHQHSRNCIGRHTERHMNQAVVRAPNSTQQHEKQQHTLAAYRKTQEEQALTGCTARRRAKSISSTHMQRAQNIMHFAIQPLRPPPQRNAKRTQQPTCHFCVPSPLLYFLLSLQAHFRLLCIVNKKTKVLISSDLNL